MAVVTPARLGKLRLNAGRLAYVAPITPHTPNPPHQSIAGPLALSWLCTPALYDVYFGTTTTPPLVGSTRSLGWVLPELVLGVTYYWRVVATNPLGTASGPLWSFTAAAPVAPTYVSPPHHSTNQPTAITLVWTHPLVAPGDVAFDVYFGPTPTPPLAQRRQTTRTYTPGPLRDGVDYYWRIVAINSAGTASGPIWTFETRNPTQGLITIGGVDVRGRTRIADLRIRDLLNVPNTCALTVDGSAPTLAAEVRIGLATLAGDDVIFGGYIDTVEAVYEGRPENRAWHVTCQDYVYGINRKKVRRRYSQQSATLIAQDLLTRDAPAGYTGTAIQAGLPIVSGGIDFTEEDLTACFARLAQRIGGYWYVDYAKDVHLFLTEAVDAPTPITAAARVLLDEPPITWEADLTQVRTRVFVEGGGAQARAAVAVGATSLPVTDASWYAPTGGQVVSGPQRIRYTGKGTVGGPAAPSATGQSVPGNLSGGPYSYVVTQITAGAESPLSAPSAPVTLPAVASPPATMTVTPISGAVPSPPTAPTVVAVDTRIPTPTTAPVVTSLNTQVVDPVSAPTVTAISLRVPLPPAPGVTPVSTAVAPPTTGPGQPVAVFTGVQDPLSTMGASAHSTPGGLVPGSNYHWDMTFGTSQGETRGQINPTLLNNLAAGMTSAQLSGVGTSADPRVTKRTIYRYEQPPNNKRRIVATINDNVTTTYIDTKADAALGGEQPISPIFGAIANTTGTGGLVYQQQYEWAVTFVTSAGETTRGPASPRVTMGFQQDAAQLSGIPTSPDGRVTKRNLYRAIAGGGQFKLEATINDNTTTTFLSVKADAQLGATPPGSNTSGTGGLVPGLAYSWAVTFGTSSGETVIGPWTTLTMPATADAPADTVSVSLPTSADGRVTKRKLYRSKAGGGPFYLVTTLNDNTTTTYTDAKTDAALGAVSPATDTTGGSLVPGGQYTWVVTYATSSGETTEGISWTNWLVINGDAAELSNLPISPDGRVSKRKIYRYGNGWQLEATINDNTTTTYISSIAAGSLGAAKPTANTTHGTGSLVMGANYAWAVSFVTATGETLIGPSIWPTTLGTYDNSASVTAIPTSADPRVVARRLYRIKAFVGPFYLETTINDNVTTTYTSTKSDAALGKVEPSSNTSGTGGLVPGWSYGWSCTFGTSSGETTLGGSTGFLLMNGDTAQLSNLPISPDPRVTSRKLYRISFESGGSWRLEATISDNTTTTYTSTKTDGALGTGPPPTNTTGTGGLTPGSYWWAVKFVTATGESGGTPTAGVLITAGYDLAQLSAIPTSPDARVTKRRIYRTAVDVGPYRFEVELADNTTTTYTSTKRDDQLGADMVSGNTTSAVGQIAVSAIALGGGTTTARKLYRTESGGSAYKLVVLINDNTTTVYQDNKADGSLGALAPVDLVTELIGIPASGTGSVLYEIRLGDDVNVLAQCDDAAAQTALAALEGGGSTGIVEHFLQDRRLSLSTANATGFADLALFARPLVTVRYATRDPKTRAGKTVTITLPELSLTGDFTIQTVEIDQIDLAPGLLPRFTVTASSIRFSLEDVLRRLQLAP